MDQRDEATRALTTIRELVAWLRGEAPAPARDGLGLGEVTLEAKRQGIDPEPALLRLEALLHSEGRIGRRRAQLLQLITFRAVLVVVVVALARNVLSGLGSAIDPGIDRPALALAALVASGSLWSLRLLLPKREEPEDLKGWLERYLGLRPDSKGMILARLGVDLTEERRARLVRMREDDIRRAAATLERIESCLPLWELWAFALPSALALVGPLVAGATG